MDNKISRFQNIKDSLRDLKWYGKEKGHDTVRHKLKIGYKTPKNHEFIPDQTKLGGHFAILHPDSLIVEDIIHTGKEFGDLLAIRPYFIQLSPEQHSQIKIGEGHPWMYVEEDKDFIQLKEINPED
jgi:hypothetical protein